MSCERLCFLDLTACTRSFSSQKHSTARHSLHRDMGDFLHDPHGRLDYRDMPCGQVVVNFPLIIAPGDHDVTVTSGAT